MQSDATPPPSHFVHREDSRSTSPSPSSSAGTRSSQSSTVLGPPFFASTAPLTSPGSHSPGRIMKTRRVAYRVKDRGDAAAVFPQPDSM